NGGDALYAGARLAARGAAVTAVLLAPERAHAAGLAALRAAGGRAVPVGADAVAAVRAARLVLDGIVGIGGSGGLRPGGAEPAGGGREHAELRGLVAGPGPEDDKYTRGVVGVAAGSSTYPGAGVLCTGSAVRGGSGMVRYAGSAAEQVRARWPEVVVSEGKP